MSINTGGQTDTLIQGAKKPFLRERLTYRAAGLADLDLLTETRIQVLRAANGLGEEEDLTFVALMSREYYEKALADGSHRAYLVFDGSAFVGAGGISYYRVMPTVHNPTGWKAYIMNMYTDPKYRRRGIATKTLDLLVGDAKSRGISHISLEATDEGRFLYERYGFTAMESEMELPVGGDGTGSRKD